MASDVIHEIESGGLFRPEPEEFMYPLTGAKLAACKALVKKRHYTRSIPSGKSHYFYWAGVIVVFSIPANMNIGKFILKRDVECWELARLWANDGHRRNALTEAISYAIRGFRATEPTVELLVSFADPNVGHEGFVYRAASWVYTGQSTESRVYISADGKVLPRRAFHAGDKGMTKAEIEARGFRQERGMGKHRFAKGLTRKASRELGKLYSCGTNIWA